MKAKTWSVNDLKMWDQLIIPENYGMYIYENLPNREWIHPTVGK
jgi:hypothetical protein